MVRGKTAAEVKLVRVHYLFEQRYSKIKSNKRPIPNMSPNLGFCCLDLVEVPCDIASLEVARPKLAESQAKVAARRCFGSSLLFTITWR